MTEALKALIVEDEQNIASFYADALGMKGIASEVVPTTAEGLGRLAKKNYHLVITDLNHEPPGTEVYRIAVSRGIDAVIITGGVSGERQYVMDDARAIAGENLLQKPVKLAEIVKLAERVKQKHATPQS